MDFSYVIEFWPLGDFTLAVELQIEMKEYKEFKRPFKTDKYINTTEWESITRNIENILLEFNKCQKNNRKFGEFTTEDDSLTVDWKFIAKDESCINFDKLKFNNSFGWILHVNIRRATSSIFDQKPNTPDYVDISFNNEYDPKDIQQYRPCKKSETNIIASVEYSPKPVTSPTRENGGKNFNYTPSKIDIEKRSSSDLHKSIFGSDDSDDDNKITIKKELESPKTEKLKTKKKLFNPLEVVETESKKKNPTRSQKKTNKKVNEAPNTINTWLSKTKNATKSQEDTPSRKRKKIQHSSDTEINDQDFQKIDEFILSAERDTEQKNRRRNELKDIDYLHCRNLSEDQLKRYVIESAEKIKQLYSGSKKKFKLTLSAATITQSKILNEHQMRFLMTQVENLRKLEERGQNLDLLTEKILPDLIVNIFGKVHKLTEDQAILRINEQEEKRNLNNSSDNTQLF